MLELQAVVGRIQLARMAQWTASRAAHAQRILDCCRAMPALRVADFAFHSDARPPGATAGSSSVHAQYKCYVYVRLDQLAHGWTRDRIVEAVTKRGVPCYQGSCSEVYLERAFDNTPWRPAERLPVARELGETSIMFLVHPTLTSAEIDATCDAIVAVMSEATSPSAVAVR
jgi:dTDP-4-amino-4,6-dideoxygalactose transaminase